MGPKDIGYVSIFDKNDLPYLYTMAEEVRATHNNNLIDEFNKKCQQKYDDHNPILSLGNKDIEFLDVSKSDDLVVDAGIAQLIRQIFGTSTVRWQYMARGTGTTTPIGTNTTLVTESGTRVDMSLSGWRENASTTLRFAAIHGESTPTITINEAGVFTALTAGTMLNRVVFNNFALGHTINITGFIISFIIQFVPKM
jgi:hypothetical protein